MRPGAMTARRASFGPMCAWIELSLFTFGTEELSLWWLPGECEMGLTQTRPCRQYRQQNNGDRTDMFMIL
jgi:hypothetical protein